MKLRFHSLKLLCNKSEEMLHFAENVTFIHGTLSLGKSSVARIIDFCLGGDLEQTTAIQREFIAAQLDLTIGGFKVLLERNRGENQITASWVTHAGEPTSVLVRAKGDGPPSYDEDVANVSDLVLRLLGYSIIRVHKRTADEQSPMVRLSFRDLLKFCYLEQEELDSSFFRLNAPVLAEKSKDALNFFTGYHSERLSSLQTEFDRLRTDQRAKREAADKIKAFLARFGFASESDIQAELDTVSAEARELEEWLQLEQTTYMSKTHFVDEQRDRLRKMSNELESDKAILDDLNSRVSDQKELLAELVSMKFKTARADTARTVLANSDFQNCPNCGRPISQHRSQADEQCYLCLQTGGDRAGDLSAVSVRNDLDARIADIQGSLRRQTVACRRQSDRISNLTFAKADLDRDLARMLSAYETDRLARTRDSERKLAKLSERAQFLERVRAMPGAVTDMLEEADEISKDLDRISREILEEQGRLSKADSNFATLENYFLEALLAVHVPGVSKKDRVRINRRTLIPYILPEGDEEEAYSFYTAGSGGKKTLITICFALALHRTAAVRNLPVPSVLIIDTPLKNITPDINPQLVSAFYQYLYRLMESDLADHQIILIDQLLVAPPADVDLDFRTRHMTEDDPEHPPLISYYRGP
jgi:RNA polymerase-binding transcription factor DksA